MIGVRAGHYHRSSASTAPDVLHGWWSNADITEFTKYKEHTASASAQLRLAEAADVEWELRRWSTSPGEMFRRLERSLRPGAPR
ncbi:MULTISPECIES: hypothetical protein [unclassified Streptomyces]|uniref:hypothetical protein n=1 Tax=unclassified Streptomyces TaxID=2593676 RepID=UPI0022515F3D|nr:MULTISPECIES: hypothetical protein [unclassified Streptomyces]MCX4649265.1 hypothetical protein [Streptomyces sp. NBC_01446]MCX5321524.1 hypothetical protein [Streptomyces sp. NBC_00120]